MQRSLSQMLLVDSDLYLQAVQHKSVQIQSLGLHEVKYPFNSVRNTTGRKVLKAVIPTNDQQDFLRKAGLLDETVPTIPEDGPASKMPTPHQSRKERAARRKKKEEDEKRRKSPKKQEDDNTGVVKHAARRTSIGGTPLFTKPSHAHLEILEREREDAIWRTKQKERFVKLGENFDIVDSEGVKYVYDYRGFKVTEEEFERQMAAIEKEKQRKSVERTIHPHNCAIIEKTRRFVDDMRRKVEEDMILDYRWYPGKFPSTTVPPRCQSAGSTRRSFSNDLRDINSLGKSLPSPFRDGVTPVLPVDLVHKWPEYRVMEEGDVVLTIEHCCNCWEHSVMTHHKEEHYLQLADEVKEALSATAMKFAVRFYAVHKPVHFQDPLHKSLSQSEKLINKDEGHRPEIKAFNVDYSTRLGAFEVQVAIKTRNNFVCHLLFSKLFRGVWPKVSSLQKLLERLLSEARFKRMESEAPEEENVGTKSPKSGTRRQSTKVVLITKKPVEEDVSEMQAEFDLRETVAPKQESQVPFSATESSSSLAIDTGVDTVTSAGEGSDSGKRSKANTAEAAPAAPPSLDEVEAAYQRYQELHRAAQAQRWEVASSADDDSQPRPALTRVGSAKATIKVIGAATAGLQMVRGKSKSAREAEHTGLISPERALEIANTHSERASMDASHPNFSKKGSSIGVLSRQNAGGGRGRYLHIEDEEAEPDSEQGDAPGQLIPVSPPAALLTRASSVASGALTSGGSSSKSPYARSNSTMSGSSGKAPFNRGSSTVSVTPFTHQSSTLQHYEEGGYEDDEQVGFSPGNSSKSIAPVATAVSLTTAGLALVRHRAASISALASAPSVIEKMRMATHKAQSEKALGGAKKTSPKNGQHRPHPSMEMRKKLDIGLLSRQSAAKGGKLVIPDDDSDDGAGSDLSDSPPPMPIKRITDAMKDAVNAVNVATEASEKRVALSAAGGAPPAPATTPAPTPAATTHAPAMVIAPIPAFTPAAAHPKVTAEAASAAPTLAPAQTEVPAPVQRESPAIAHKTAAHPAAPENKSSTVHPPASAAPVTAPAEGKEPAPQASDAAATTASQSAAPQVETTAAEAGAEAALAGPKPSAAELLLQRRLMTEQLLSDVSKDIFQRADSQGPAALGEYGDDFEDFDNFSPTKSNNATGFEDLFDTAEFQLSQVSEGTQERA